MKRLLILLWFSVSLYGIDEAERIKFEYQELIEPFNKYDCSHVKSSVGLYEWDVQCSVDGFLKKYFVHLVKSFYPKTIFGVNAYEILYWVTDTTLSTDYKHNSVSIWLHNSSNENKLNLLETFLGVENDLAALRLTYLLK